MQGRENRKQEVTVVAFYTVTTIYCFLQYMKNREFKFHTKLSVLNILYIKILKRIK